ncbi:MAG: glycosyltransferase [Acetobacteraceae bacterium]|nr:glycosyltransferase [Acetobacteraceae bacterium]
MVRYHVPTLTVLSVAYPLAPVSPDAAGGAEQILAAIDRALVAAGHRSFVMACAGSRVAGTLIQHRLPPGAVTDAARTQVQAELRQALVRVPKQEQVDVIHLHGIDFSAYLPSPGPACLITLHLPPSWYPPEAFALARPDTWLHGVSAHQHRHCPSSPALLPPIQNGVPVEALSTHRHARRSFALMLGRVCPEKGQHLALEAAHSAGVPVLLGGEVFPYPAHQDYFAEQVAPLLDQRRRWLGPIGFNRKRRLLSAARCVLIPSLAEETASLVAMEAMACGTPVIAFPSGALAEIVEPGRTGFLVRDVAGMAEAIARSSEIEPATCRAVARARFPLKRMTDAYLARYAELAQCRRMAA